jgi:hypothetical protein
MWVYSLIISILSFQFSLFVILLVFDSSVVVLDVKSSDVPETNFHALFFCGGEEFVFEGVDAGVEALGVEVY